MGRDLHIFISYSHKDEALRDQLVAHLSLLRRQGYVVIWHDRKILPGATWSHDIDQHLQEAQIILLLISADFIQSDYCYGVELEEAIKKDRAGTACVIPIILRPVDWHEAPFGKFQALPKDGKPITTWPDRDEAFTDVAKGVRAVVKALL